MILDSIRRHDGRLCSRKKEQLEQRTVALLHTRAYFRFVLTLGILRKLWIVTTTFHCPSIQIPTELPIAKGKWTLPARPWAVKVWPNVWDGDGFLCTLSHYRKLSMQPGRKTSMLQEKQQQRHAMWVWRTLHAAIIILVNFCKQCSYCNHEINVPVKNILQIHTCISTTCHSDVLVCHFFADESLDYQHVGWLPYHTDCKNPQWRLGSIQSLTYGRITLGHPKSYPIYNETKYTHSLPCEDSEYKPVPAVQRRNWHQPGRIYNGKLISNYHEPYLSSLPEQFLAVSPEDMQKSIEEVCTL